MLKDVKTLREISEDTECLGKCQNKKLRTFLKWLCIEIQELKKSSCEVNICVYKGTRQEID